MPIIASAKKRVRVAAKATERNRAVKRTFRDADKAFQAAVKAGKSADITSARSQVDKVLDTMVKKNIIHKNKAARKKSQFAAAAKAAGAKVAAAKPKAKTPAAKKAPAKKAPVKKAAATKKTADKLNLIEGVGPKISDLLQADGIKTFADLAKATPASIKKILAAAGPRYTMHDPASWPKQAKLAAAGKMDELKKLQDELSGGK